MKTMTVNRLYKALGQLIEDGYGRLPVCVNKDTFQHNLEGDGCVILPVNHVLAQHVVQIDDDGGTKMDAKGRECYRHNAVLLGDAADSEGKCEPPTRDSPPTHACDKLRGALDTCVDVLVHLRRYRDQHWDSNGDRPSSPPAAFFGIDSALDAARAALAETPTMNPEGTPTGDSVLDYDSQLQQKGR